LPEIFFYGLGAMFMAILNIKHVYRPGAWSPVLNNVVVMLTVLLFWALPGPKSLDPSSMTNTQILVIGIGTTLGIAAQALVLVPAMGVTLFGYGQASIADAHLIGSALAWSAFGLLPFALVMLQLRVFYAMRDGRTPTLINGFMVGTKVALVLVTNEVFKAP